MYGEGNAISTIAPPVATLGVIALLPATGASFITSFAVAIAAGLSAWGAVYLIKVTRS